MTNAQLKEMKAQTAALRKATAEMRSARLNLSKAGREIKALAWSNGDLEETCQPMDWQNVAVWLYTHQDLVRSERFGQLTRYMYRVFHGSEHGYTENSDWELAAYAALQYFGRNNVS